MTTEDFLTEWKGQTTVFVNYVDCYLTEFIAKTLASSVVGLTQMEDDLRQEFELNTKKRSHIEISPDLYRVIGTLKDPSSPKPHFVKGIVSNKNLLELFLILQQCDVIIYDICVDPSQCAEALFMAQKLTENMLKMDEKIKKTFIAISSVLTWSSSDHSDLDEIGVLVDEDFRRRRPHSKYRELYTTEKLIMQYRRKKKALQTIVIAPGLIYGDKEEVFHHIFQAAWLNKAIIPMTGKGHNHLPTIHIKDFTKIVQYVIEKPSNNLPYILAVDLSQNTLKEITKAVNKAIGSGVIQDVDMKDKLDPLHIDLLTLDLKMTCRSLAENFNFEWVSPNGMIENINELIDEFRNQRNLKPLKLIVLGPPGSGKSSISRRLKDSHKFHVVGIDEIQRKLLGLLEQRRKEKEALKAHDDRSQLSLTATVDVDEDTEMENEVDEKDKEEKENFEAFLDSVEESMSDNKVIEESALLTYLKRLLLSKPFQNQGFILDGFPRTAQQVTQLFGTLDKINEAKATYKEDPEAMKVLSILPDQVIILQATDELLKERIRNLPASLVEGTENEEKSFTARLEAYRKLNTVESSIEDDLDELEFNISFHDVSKDKTGVNANIINQIILSIGPPRTYGPSKEEIEMAKQTQMEQLLKAEKDQKEEEERLLAEEESLNNEKKLQWTQKHIVVEAEDQALASTQALPLRHYLFKFVMPTLLQALTDCCKVMPDDPLDYLAEYLLNCNPIID